jgi:hypothetical protein
MALNKNQKILLAIDSGVNLFLGALLLLFPAGMLDLLGLPPVLHHFYTTILGAVIFGIGIALLIELMGRPHGINGLGLSGAIAINLCGGSALLMWLLMSPFDLPFRGSLVLWSVCVVVLGVGAIELITKSWKAV